MADADFEDYMGQYKRFIEWVRLLSLFSAVFIADLILRHLEHTKIPFLASAAFIGLMVIATMHVMELLATTVFERLGFVRRFVLGDDCIEGMWFDNVVGEDLFGLITIQFRDGGISISGEQYDAAGKITATWENYVVAFEGCTLRAIYRAPQFRGGVPSEVYGFTTYVFTGRPGKPPSFFSGFFADISGESRKCQLRGFRITDKKIMARIGKPESRREAIAELMQQWRVQSDKT